MLYPVIEADYRAAIREDWEQFLAKAAQFDGTLDSYHVVNQTLGYNLAKTVGPLILEIERLEQFSSQRDILIRTLHERIGSQEKYITRLTAEVEAQRERIRELEGASGTKDV